MTLVLTCNTKAIVAIAERAGREEAGQQLSQGRRADPCSLVRRGRSRLKAVLYCQTYLAVFFVFCYSSFSILSLSFVSNLRGLGSAKCQWCR